MARAAAQKPRSTVQFTKDQVRRTSGGACVHSGAAGSGDSCAGSRAKAAITPRVAAGMAATGAAWLACGMAVGEDCCGAQHVTSAFWLMSWQQAWPARIRTLRQAALHGKHALAAKSAIRIASPSRFMRSFYACSGCGALSGAGALCAAGSSFHRHAIHQISASR